MLGERRAGDDEVDGCLGHEVQDLTAVPNELHPHRGGVDFAGS